MTNKKEDEKVRNNNNKRQGKGIHSLRPRDGELEIRVSDDTKQRRR